MITYQTITATFNEHLKVLKLGKPYNFGFEVR